MTGKIAKPVTGKIHFWPIYHFNKFVFDLFICNRFSQFVHTRSPEFHMVRTEQLHLFLPQWQGPAKSRGPVVAGSLQRTVLTKKEDTDPSSSECLQQTQERNYPAQRWSPCLDCLLLCFPCTTSPWGLDTWGSKIKWHST